MTFRSTELVRLLRAVLLVSLMYMVASPAFAWAPGTHIYMVNHLETGLTGNQPNLNFGAISVDLNQVLSTNQKSEFFSATHYEFMPMWQATRKSGTPNQMALAYGWLSHNEEWGADHYAHIASTVYPAFVNPYSEYAGQNGYVWKKSAELCQRMTTELNSYGMGSVADKYLSGPSGLMNCHFIVEYGMDLLVRASTDPQIGTKVKAAAASHDKDALAALLLNAYPTPSQEYRGAPMGAVMVGGANGWSQLMFMYGDALSKDDFNVAFASVSNFLTLLAGNLLGVQDPRLNTLIQLGLLDSLDICKADFGLELGGTIVGVRRTMNVHRMKQ